MEKKIMMTGRKILGLFVILIAVLFASCSVKQEVELSSDGSGTAAMSADIDPMLVTYLQSLAELTGEGGDGNLFDVDEISKGIKENPELELISISNKDDMKIDAEIAFNDIENLIKQSEENLNNKKVFSFTEKGKIKEIEIYIDIDNFLDIAPIFPFVEEPLFLTFGPIENQGLAEDDYLEMMEYALGDGGGQLIKKSMISTTINIDGKLISQSGGEVSGKNSVTFNTPLIRLLLLDEPIHYSIKFE